MSSPLIRVDASRSAASASAGRRVGSDDRRCAGDDGRQRVGRACAQQHAAGPGSRAGIADGMRSVGALLDRDRPFHRERARVAERDLAKQARVELGEERSRAGRIDLEPHRLGRLAGLHRGAELRRQRHAHAFANDAGKALPGLIAGELGARFAFAPDDQLRFRIDALQQRQQGGDRQQRRQHDHRQRRQIDERQCGRGKVHRQTHCDRVPGRIAGPRQRDGAAERQRGRHARRERCAEHRLRFGQRAGVRQRPAATAAGALEQSLYLGPCIENDQATAVGRVGDQCAELALIEGSQGRRVDDQRVDARIGRCVAWQIVGSECDRVKAFERDELARRQREAEQGRLGLRKLHLAARRRSGAHLHATAWRRRRRGPRSASASRGRAGARPWRRPARGRRRCRPTHGSRRRSSAARRSRSCARAASTPSRPGSRSARCSALHAPTQGSRATVRAGADGATPRHAGLGGTWVGAPVAMRARRSPAARRPRRSSRRSCRRRDISPPAPRGSNVRRARSCAAGRCRSRPPDA